MGNWITASEISRNYVVGEERLLAYGQRGNLAFRRRPDGVILYEDSDVARFFRKRHAAFAGAMIGGNGASGALGVLGTTRLGQEPARSTRRRSGPHELRLPETWDDVTERRAAG